MNKKIWFLLLTAGLVALAAACGGGETGDSAADEVNFGYFPNLDHAAGLIGKEKGYLEEHLQDTQVNFQHFPNGNDFIEQLDAGGIDIGYVGPGPAINYHLRGGDVVILGAAANGATLIVSNKDSGIETLTDFEGKSFGTPGNGCTHNVQLEKMLQDEGMVTNRLGGVVEHQPHVAPSNTLTMFEQGELDAYTAPEPWGTYLVEELGANVVTEWNDVFLGETLASVVLVTTSEFMEEHPEKVDQVLQAHIESVQFAQENEAETLELVNDVIEELTQTRLPEEVLEKAWQRLEVTAETFPETLQDWADASYDLQFYDEEPDLEGLVDTSRLEQLLAEM